MTDRRGSQEVSEVFERLQKLAIHERRRRWDSTKNALSTKTADAEKAGTVTIPTNLLGERFDSLEFQLAALAREIRRVEQRSKALAIRVWLVGSIGLIAAASSIGLWSGAVHQWYETLSH